MYQCPVIQLMVSSTFNRSGRYYRMYWLPVLLVLSEIVFL